MVDGEGNVGLAAPIAPFSVFGNQNVGGDGKAESQGSFSAAGASSQIPTCPNSCKTGKIYRDGLRYKRDSSEIQRWLCTCCGLRFSDKPLKSEAAIDNSCQICVQGAKNLGSATELKTVAGEKKKPSFPFAIIRNIDLIDEESRGLLTKFMAYLERENYSPDIQYPATLARLVKDSAELLKPKKITRTILLDPEDVKTVIARMKKRNDEPWSDSMKMLAVCAYSAFCEMQEIHWKPPTYAQDEANVYLPDEKELDILIHAAQRKKMAAFLMSLKYTLADPEEVIRVEWDEFKAPIMKIMHPVKGHYSGEYELPDQLCEMINSLPRKDKRIFATSYDTLYNSFVKIRARTAERYHNPNLLKITFKSFRHWGGTMLAYMTHGDVPEIARVLRHKNWKSTQKYVHRVKAPFKEEDFETTSATTPEEILALGKAGWQKYDEGVFNGVHYSFYRKPKQFGGFHDGVQTQVHKSEKRVDRFLCSAIVSMGCNITGFAIKNGTKSTNTPHKHRLLEIRRGMWRTQEHRPEDRR